METFSWAPLPVTSSWDVRVRVHSLPLGGNGGHTYILWISEFLQFDGPKFRPTPYSK
jgi:hypothetical protein